MYFHAHVQSIGLEETHFTSLLEIDEQDFFAKLECFRENQATITQADTTPALTFNGKPLGDIVGLLKQIVSPPSLLQQLVYAKLPEGEKRFVN